jgi:plastocyanin
VLLDPPDPRVPNTRLMNHTRVPSRSLSALCVAALVVAALALAGCSSGSSKTTAAGTSTTSGAAKTTTSMSMGSSSITSAPAPAAGPNGVNIVNYAFAPSTLTVKVGTTVTWKNYDQFAHEVISTTGDPGQPFDLGQQATGATVSHTFTTAGTYQYYCNIHNYMKGTIVVTP